MLDLLLKNEKDTAKREAYPDMIIAAKNKVAEINRYAFKENLRKFCRNIKFHWMGSIKKP